MTPNFPDNKRTACQIFTHAIFRGWNSMVLYCYLSFGFIFVACLFIKGWFGFDPLGLVFAGVTSVIDGLILAGCGADRYKKFAYGIFGFVFMGKFNLRMKDKRYGIL